MIGWVRLSALLFAAALTGVARTQPSPSRFQTGADVIEAIPWDTAKEGPLLVRAPMQVSQGQTLEDLNLKRVKIGGLTAYVPKAMVIVDTNFREEPNLYDGLPRDQKVLYLMCTLTPAQWTKATDTGLSLDDCRGEQKAIFESILPEPFQYTVGKVSGRGISHGPSPQYQTLNGNDRAKVKLRIIRHLEVVVGLENNGGWTGTSFEEDEKEGAEMPFLSDDDSDLYGHKVLASVPNALRKSHLVLTEPRFDKTIELVRQESIEALLKRVSKVTGVQIVPAKAYARMSLVEKGATASTKDILEALQLSVGGVYRKVGSAFVLTNDLEGMAAHQARFELWKSEIDHLVTERTTQWRAQLKKNGGLAKIPFKSNAYQNLTDAERKNLEENDGPQNAPIFIPISQASKPFASAIQNWSYGNKIDREKVGLSSSIRYQIVMPNGQRCWWQGWLGNYDQFSDKPYVWSAPNPPPVPLPLSVDPHLQAVVVKVDAIQTAIRIIDAAAKLGIPELLLQTSSEKVLEACVQSGAGRKIKIGLAVQPWELMPGETTPDPDRTVLGVHGSSLAQQKQSLLSWQRFWQSISAFEPAPREYVGPQDPLTIRHIQRASSLAAVQGLSRVVILNVAATGYAKAKSNISGSYYYSNAIDAALGLGYTTTQRQAYFDKQRVDPLDLTDDNLGSRIRFEKAWADAYDFRGGLSDWITTRGQWQSQRNQQLVAAITRGNSKLPIVIQGELKEDHQPPLFSTPLFKWNGVGELPVAPEDYGGGSVPPDAALQWIIFAEHPDAAQRNRFAARLQAAFKDKVPVLLDATSIPPGRLELLLKSWFKTAKAE